MILYELLGMRGQILETEVIADRPKGVSILIRCTLWFESNNPPGFVPLSIQGYVYIR